MTRILLIDDETSTRQLLATVLADAGHHVTQAADGRTGLHLLQLDDADLVVTDVIMPGLNGLALIGELRARAPGAPSSR
jgi:DNA-binding response OmpR family regulator